jgi:hypothetical protein
VLGVGSIPSVELGGAGYKSKSTNVPVNGAYILAEDQDGVGAQFGSNGSYFDYSGVKNTIATRSENFVTAVGNFSTAEQGSLVSQQLTGVCINSNGCASQQGTQTSVYEYKMYPISIADQSAGSGSASYGTTGKFGRKIIASTGAEGWSDWGTPTQSPENWWTRSPSAGQASGGTRGVCVSYANGTPCANFWETASYGFRPAGVLNLDQSD